MKDELSEDQELKEFDQWMKALPVQRVGESFTATVIASAMLMQKRNRSMKLLIWTIGLCLAVIVMSMFLEPTRSIDLPNINVPKLDLAPSVGIVEIMKSFFMKSSVVMFCVVIEAILCLLVIDQIANYYRYIKRNIIKLRT